MWACKNFVDAACNDIKKYEDDKMFEKEKRSGIKMTLFSIISSFVISLLVFFLGSRYVSWNEPITEPDQGNKALQMSYTGNQAEGTGKSVQDGGQISADQGQLNPTRLLAGDPAGIMPVAQAVAKRATTGVVGITVERVQQAKLFDKNNTVEVGVGSGVVVSSDGYILTNNHVAGGKSKRIIVSFADGRNVDGEVVWSDPVLDLAAVKVNLTGLTALVLGDASKLQVGEPAIAIGNPLGLEFQRTVTSGIISALNRTIRIDTELGSNYMEDLIQTDASINPGNSGGPLLNSNGEVIGINTIKVSSAEAIGFAIPINISKPIIEKLTKTGSFTEPYLGLFAYDKNVIPYVDGEANVQNGIYVAHVDTEGPAYGAGIREGCIIRQVDGIDIDTMLQLRTYIYSKAPGDTINLTHLIHGSGQWTTTQATLARKVRDGLITR